MIDHPPLFGMVSSDWMLYLLAGIVLIQFIAILVVFVLLRRRGGARGSQQESGQTATKKNGSSWSIRSGIRGDLYRLRSHLGAAWRKSPVFLVLGDPLPPSLATVFTDFAGEYLEGSQLDFHLYDRGTLLVPKGGDDDFLFHELLRLRPYRPLDGVVLSVSGDAIRSSDVADHSASHLHERLVRLQRITGMRFPVQLLIHDGEKLSGFQELGRLQFAAETEEIPTWNSPYRPTTPWTSDWLEEAGEAMLVKLRRAWIDAFSSLPGENVVETRRLFLLADELERLGPGLERFCHFIFAQGIYHEPFLFRGLSICGTVAEESKPARFVFAQRMFRECLPNDAALAVPVRQIVQARSRNVRILQTACVTLLLLWGCGMFWQLPVLKQDVKSVERFGKNWDVFYDHDQSLVTALEHQGDQDVKKIVPVSGDTVWEIVTATKKENCDNLRSIFFPGSYLSPLQENVRLWYVEFYEDLVNKSIPTALTWKAHEIYRRESSSTQEDDTRQEFVVPLETPEYKRLERYVRDSSNFHRMFDHYESLLKTGRPDELLELMRYLWKTDDVLTVERLREEGCDTESLLAEVIRRRNISLRNQPNADPLLERKKEIAAMDQSRFKKLSRSFDERIYRNNALLAHLERLEKILNDTETHVSARFDHELLDRYWTDMNQAILGIKDERYNWILDQSPLFNDANLPLREAIRKETFLDATDIAAWDEFSATKKRGQFDRLANLKTERRGLFFELREMRRLAPLPWLESLTTLLDSLRHEQFTRKVEKAFIISLAGNPASVEWDSQLIQDVLQFSQRYDQCLQTTELKRFPLIEEKSRQQLIDNMHKLLVDARRMRRTTPGTPEIHGNFAEVAPSILRILDIYRSLGNAAKRQYEELATVADQQAIALLADLDGRFLRDRLYDPSRETLAAWNGRGVIIVPVLGIGSEGEVDNYLALRRQRLSYWKTRIDPVLAYLIARNDFSPPSDDASRIERWKTIQDGIEQYDTHTPNNPVTALEQFVKMELPKPEHQPLSPSPNWFYQKMYELDVAARNGNAKRTELDFFARWNTAAEFFNKYLSGRFPFVADDFAKAPSASPDAIRAFYTLLPDLPKTAVDWVIPEDYIRFHETMTAVKPLFFGKLQGPNTIPDLIVSVQYRFADPSECGCQRILDQSFQFGGQELSVRNGVCEGVWKFGSAVRFTLQWAKDGGVVPSTAPENRSAKIQGNRMIYDYDTPWSLLVFLCENVQPVLVKDAAGDVDRSVNVLSFDVATRPGGSNPTSGNETDRLRTFVRIRLQKANGDAEAEEIVLPRRFPDWMPTEGGNKRFDLSEKRPDTVVRNPSDPQKITPPALPFTTEETIIEWEDCPPGSGLMSHFPILTKPSRRNGKKRYIELPIPPLGTGEIFQGWNDETFKTAPSPQAIPIPMQKPYPTPTLAPPVPNDNK